MKSVMRYFELSAGSGLHKVQAVAVLCGKDINICFGGGDTFHIGASALAVPRPSLSDENMVSASASVICVTAHKEDEIARQAALKLAASFNTKVNITCGLHIDNATKEDIELLYKNYLDVLEKLEKGIAEYFKAD